MFTEMITHLRAGTIPDPETIRPRLNAALVKKLAIIRQPYSFWSSDTKSNPDTEHMLWATIFLQDSENYGVIAGVLAVEDQERAHFQCRDIAEGYTSPGVDDLVGVAVSNLLYVTNDTAIDKEVRRRVERIGLPQDRFK